MAEINEYKDNYSKKIKSFDDKLRDISFELNDSNEKIRNASDDIEAMSQAICELAELIGGEE